jgi:hypothetical protein
MQQKNKHSTPQTNLVSKVLLKATKGISYLLESLTSSHHKFNPGDILALKSRNLNYGIKPVIVVTDYIIKKDQFGKQGLYNIILHKDSQGKEEAERIVETHEYAKLIIERDFKGYSSIEEALASYNPW